MKALAIIAGFVTLVGLGMWGFLFYYMPATAAVLMLIILAIALAPDGD